MSSRTASRIVSRIVAIALVVAVAGCAGLGLRDPVSVHVVGLEPMPGEGMETRFALKLRVQNPNEAPLEFDGVFVEFDVRGSRLASGVSDQRGLVPRFGETVITVPMSVSVGAMIRQVIGLATAERVRADYQMRGKLAGPAFGGYRFESKGEVQLPTGLLGAER